MTLRSRVLTLALLLLAMIASSEVAMARPGGGHSYRGSATGTGSSPSSSGAGSWGGGSRSSSPGHGVGFSGSGSAPKSSSGGWFTRTEPTRETSWSSTPSYSAPWARPEPPSNYSPGKGSYASPRYRSSGKTSGAASEFFFLFIALFVAGAVVVAVAMLYRRRSEEAWALGELRAWGDGSLDEIERQVDAELARHRERQESIEQALAALSSKDAGFSYAVFCDFAYALFAEVHRARGNGRLGILAPFLAEAVREELGERACEGVRDVIVGAMSVEGISIDRTRRRVEVVLRFSSNLTEIQESNERAYYLEEQWRLVRHADAKSRPPERASTIDCPGCGAALERRVGEACKYCGEKTGDGRFDWVVDDVRVLEKSTRPPMLTGTTEEVGTELPTVVTPGAKRRLTELCERDPAFRWGELQVRVALIFRTFHAAWSAQDLAPVRPFLSDSLFSVQSYWVAAYKAQQLRNVTEGASVLAIECANVGTDAHYDAITVRVYASCIDYTLDAGGQCVGGHMKDVRNYTEYWTLIRSRERRGPAGTSLGCPNCGAGIDHINMVGHCESCKKKVTTGAFDWVLSRIEQDESYAG